MFSKLLRDFSLAIKNYSEQLFVLAQLYNNIVVRPLEN